MVEDSQDDLVHVLPQTQVNLLLLFQSINQLGDTRKKKSLKKSVQRFCQTLRTGYVHLSVADQPHPLKRCQSPQRDTEL